MILGTKNVFQKLAFVSATALVTGGYASSSQAACDPTLAIVEIEIKNMAFIPAEIEVCVGQIVRWTNNEPTTGPRLIKHTVTADPTLARNPANVLLPAGAAPFDSGLIAPTQTFEQSFTVAGEYRYICRPHEAMGHVGKLFVVEPTDNNPVNELNPINPINQGEDLID